MSDEIEADGTEATFPDWYLENYKSLETFLAMTQDERSTLVGEASGIFGTVLAALTPEGQGTVMGSGKAFLEANLEALDEKYAGMPRELLLYLMLGVAVECIGIQQMKIEMAKAGC